jgi:hypothetical protein
LSPQFPTIVGAFWPMRVKWSKNRLVNTSD